jgi:hypothetical protein
VIQSGEKKAAQVVSLAVTLLAGAAVGGVLCSAYEPCLASVPLLATALTSGLLLGGVAYAGAKARTSLRRK